MSDLNLAIDAQQILIQTGLFLTNFVCVKNFFINPYNELKKKREALTAGSSSDARGMLTKCERTAEDIEQRLQAVNQDVRVKREQAKKAAVHAQSELIASTKSFVDKQKAEMKVELDALATKETQALPVVVDKIYQQALFAVKSMGA